MKIYTKVVSLILVTSLAAPAAAGTRNVDCDAGGSLQKALASGQGSAAPIEIEVTGTCYGTFTMSRDRVTILGDGSTTIHGTLRMFGSQQVVLRDLIFTGPGAGLRITNSRARIFDTQFVDNDGSGINASDNSVVRLSRSQVVGNWEGVRVNNSHLVLSASSVEQNHSDGVLVLQNSSLAAWGGSISHNNALGIRAWLNSSIQIDGTRIEFNQYGIQMLTASSGELRDVLVNNNSSFGIELRSNSALEVSRGTVNDNGENGILVNEHSLLKLNDVPVTGNTGHGIEISLDGGVLAYGFTQIFGNTDYYQVVCHGRESSIEVADEAVVGPWNCPYWRF